MPMTIACKKRVSVEEGNSAFKTVVSMTNTFVYTNENGDVKISAHEI